MPDSSTRTADPNTADPSVHPTPSADLGATVGGGDAHTVTGPPASAGRYALGDEIARGGMGVVYRATDAAFGRTVAVKVLQERFGPAAARRFDDEARITAQLQHPGIPPVHDLGTLPDGRPFLAMKLIGGDTLAHLLKARYDPAADRGRFVAAFEQACHAVGYAHAHGVVHRDLKPANVMVGKFGEVQVVDWGLAKVLADRRDPAPDPDAATGTDIRTAPAGDDPFTQPGAVLGTPAFMPPEQALGAVDQIDPRSDVFGLGGILAVVLTGAPPFVGETRESTRQMAAKGKVGDCFDRLDASGADPELIALCKRCLAAEKEDRPTDAGAVATAVAGLRAAADERARQAELDRVRVEGERAAADVKAAERRKRARVQLGLAATVVLLVAGGAAFAWWRDRQEGERKLAGQTAEAERLQLDGAREVAEARAEAESGFKAKQARQGIDAGLVQAAALRKQYRFTEAERALALAADLAAGGAPERLAEVEQARRDLAFVVQLDDIRYRKWIWIADGGTKGKGEFNAKIASPEYRKAFADRGLDLTALDAAEAARRIAASGVKAELMAATDDWAFFERDKLLRRRLLEVARRADPGSWADRLRDPAVRADKAALQKLAADADPKRTPPAALTALAGLMWAHGLDPSPLLNSARATHPNEFELAFLLGVFARGERQNGPSIGPYEAARALRPENVAVWVNLGFALHAKGDFDGAAAVWKRATELAPTFAGVHYSLGAALLEKKDFDGAVAACRRATELDPNDALAHTNLGAALQAKGHFDGAIAAHKRAIELDPKTAEAHNNLGLALLAKRDSGGAVAAHRRATELAPKSAVAHNNLGNALFVHGDVAGSVAACQRATELDPKLAAAHYNLGNALQAKGDLDGGVAAYKRAIELDPKHAAAHTNLGAIYFQQQKYPDAIACARAANQADPKYAKAYAMLGDLLYRTGDLTGARVALTEAARLDKRWAPMLAKLPPIPVAPAPREVTRP